MWLWTYTLTFVNVFPKHQQQHSVFLHEEVLGCDDAATAVDDVHHVPEERVQNRDGEQTVVVPVPQIMDAIGDVTQRAPERMHSRVVEQIVDLAAPLILEKNLEIIQLVPLERIKDQIVEHIEGVPVPQIKEDIVQNLGGEQIVDVLVPQIQGDVLQHVAELVQNRTSVSRSCGMYLCHRCKGTFCSTWRSACRIVRRSRLRHSLCLSSWTPGSCGSFSFSSTGARALRIHLCLSS